MKSFFMCNKGFILPGVLILFSLYMSIVAYYIIQYELKFKTLYHLEQYYDHEINVYIKSIKKDEARDGTK
ncbi:hypothetical protein [Staphylococcus massiliensis]|uniref:Uncharacterized protein n=1 Tax=Staphylococcus massiliensis S46 TaxID=1229783 RepID=K9ARI6_9STAP|nr:hypothetical protein [Staphylococcus massiliensis]EKU49869.1 hypothetical protein C273_03205 [Staphylococcus massiliensis S46]MCG3398973.1 hypothetical protein [Staphylococcus massiliensis]MCG3401025.1 hypothetical protein [Staphylococcus massiliensis]MCG3413022.1 hypothetical protein [Staphylococcus massiliensis]POA02038.1 hypothetical protein CD133_00110 [Staphylococcus massiliensis CCUG 55927]